jgi:hypothetical protein
MPILNLKYVTAIINAISDVQSLLKEMYNFKLTLYCRESILAVIHLPQTQK